MALREWSALALVLAGCASEGRGTGGPAAAGEAASFEGEVVDDLGAALPEAEVEILGSPTAGDFGDTFPLLGRTRTGDDGRFALGGLPPGPCFVLAEVPDHAPVHLLPMTAPARGVRLVCPRWGRVRFRLVPPHGEAPPERVELGIATSPRHRPGSRSQDRGDGAFERGDFAPGPQELVLVAPGWAPVATAFTAEAGRAVDIGEIPLDRGHSLQGIVQDERGAPLGGARIGAGDGWDRDVLADAGGNFRMDHLPPGEVYLWASARGHEAHRLPVQVPAGDGGIRIVLRRGGILHVRIRTKDGGMPYSCGIRWVDLDAPDPRAGDVEWQVSGGGEFDLDLRAGRYRVEHLWPWIDRVAASREVALEVGGERTVEFVEGEE